MLFVLLVKAGAISLKKPNGFTLIETIIAVSILMSVIMTIAPIISTILTEQSILSDRRALAYALHDELQLYLWTDSKELPDTYRQNIHSKEVTFQFTKEDNYVKGCVNWENVKQKNESLCLYGLQTE